MDDLAVLDRDDGDESIVVVLVPGGDRAAVHRVLQDDHGPVPVVIDDSSSAPYSTRESP
jgi:hypothetical protein